MIASLGAEQQTKDLIALMRYLETQSSTSAKLSAVQGQKNNPLVQQVFRLAYDPHTRFQIKERLNPAMYALKGIAEATKQQFQTVEYDWNTSQAAQEPLSVLGRVLNNLEFVVAGGRLTGNAAKYYLWYLRRSLVKAEEEIFWRVVEKDLQVGLNKTSVEKIWAGATNPIEVMLAGSNLNKIYYPAISQLKADGCRTITKVEDGVVSFFTRNNKIIPLTFEPLLQTLKQLPSGTYDGELVMLRDKKVLSRKEGNGLINALIKGSNIPPTLEPHLILWDVVGSEPYHERWGQLQDLAKPLNCPWVSLVETRIVSDYNEAMTHYQELRKRGEEGSILKNLAGLWVPKRSQDLCKLKGEYTGEFQVVGWDQGTGKNAGRLGSIKVISQDREVECWVGTGFSDQQREEYTADFIVGSLVEVKYNELIQSKDPTKRVSLFLPRFIEIRFDKSQADTLEELQHKEII